MEQEPLSPQSDEVMLSVADIRHAAAEGIISESDSQNLIGWACARSVDPTRRSVTETAEVTQGFNLVSIAYYFGAMLMISACAWFLGDKWESLGTSGILVTSLIYFVIAAATGWWLRAKGYVVGGGLLVTVAVCLVPLTTYSIENLTGLWPAESPGNYADYYPLIRGSWIVMELATMAAAAVALYFVRFGFLTAPMAFSLWFFSMDVAALILKEERLDSNTYAWISVGVGLGTMLIGYGLDRTLNTRNAPRTQDFAFWCYLFGLMAFWGGFTAMDSSSEFNAALYCLLNIGLIAVAIFLKRTVFLVFGAVGVHVYLGHLAYVVFRDSVLFPFSLAFIGLSLILVTVLAQSYLRKRSKTASSM